MNNKTISENFVSINSIIPEAIIEMRYYSTYNFVGKRINGYEENCAILTKEAALALKKVSDELIEKGYFLKIFDAYRPTSAVNHFLQWAKDINDNRMKKIFYPDFDKTTLFDQGYICSPSSHSRGSTVDITLVNKKTGKEVDMGGFFDYFGKSSHFNYDKITKEQYNNRLFLREIMVSHGFIPIKKEWWHFTLKDEPFPNTYFNFPVSSKSI